MERYSREENYDTSMMSRSSRNALLYKEINNGYDDLDTLPIPDNTNEINREDLRRLMGEIDDNRKESSSTSNDNYYALSNNFKEDKVYDINRLLEDAKKGNNKVKDSEYDTSGYKLLSTLENRTLTKEDVSNYTNNYKKIDISNDIDSSVKYQTKRISVDPFIEQIITSDSTSELSLDILSDLKPTDSSDKVDKPVLDIDNSENTSDIDIINEKDLPSDVNSNDGSFYTDMYNFSNKDFDDDFMIEDNKHPFVKVLFLILLLVFCACVIYFFVTRYGIN